MAEDAGPDVAELVEAAASGDGEAWSAIVDRFAGLIWSVARAQGLSGADASDVSQTTWLRFAEHLGRLREPGRAGSWLATTARREAQRVSRAGSRDILVDPWADLDVDDGASEADASLLQRERDLVVQEAVASLPGRCRELLTALVAEPPLSYSDISDRTGMPVGSIGPTRSRCLEHLRQLIARIESAPSLPRVGARESSI